MLVVEANKASSRIGTAPDRHLVSVFCAFLGATNIPGSCPEYTQYLPAWLRANIEIVLCALRDLELGLCVSPYVLGTWFPALNHPLKHGVLLRSLTV